jgi:hypothetical protein
MFDFHLFPYTDFNKISLEWVIDCLKGLRGGLKNQMLVKKSDEEFDFEWVDNNAIPAPTAPTTGQYLAWNGTSWEATSLPLYTGGVN